MKVVWLFLFNTVDCSENISLRSHSAVGWQNRMTLLTDVKCRWVFVVKTVILICSPHVKARVGKFNNNLL